MWGGTAWGWRWARKGSQKGRNWDFPVKAPPSHWVLQHRWKTPQSFPEISHLLQKWKWQGMGLYSIFLRGSSCSSNQILGWKSYFFLFFIFVLVWFLLLPVSTSDTEYKFHGLSRKTLQEMEKHLSQVSTGFSLRQVSSQLLSYWRGGWKPSPALC